MKVVHFSDIHGKLDRLQLASREQDADLFICTGDLCPNENPDDLAFEIANENRWLNETAPFFKRLFAGRPVLVIPGNHDFADICASWSKHGINVIPVLNTIQTINGFSFAGFREINYIQGEWVGELRNVEMQSLVDRVVGLNPDLLITHAPPHGILDGDEHYGITALATQLTWRRHTIKYHFFGHCHSSRGVAVDMNMKMLFSNAATCMNIIHIEKE